MSDQHNSSVLRRALLRIEQLEAQLDEVGAQGREPLALVGLGCRLPGNADNPDALWRFLDEGGDAIGEMPGDRWDVDAYYDPEPGSPGKIYTRRGGFLRDVDRFDAAFFGISPREAAHLDPQQRLLLEVAWEALEHGGLAPHRLRGSRTGVFIGQATYDYAHLQVKSPDPAGFDAYFGTGVAASVASGRISYSLGLQGPTLTLDTACSSSLVALHLACQALRRKECDLALVGGVNLILSPEAVIAMCQSRMMAPDGRCKTFDAAADGFGQAEGCVVVLVKRLSDALRDGDAIAALIRGAAVNHDGASSGLTAPSGPAQEAVIRAALQDAGVAPDAVAYVEAHGTGTSLGDPIEAQAISAVFKRDSADAAPLLVGSIKTNLGHLEAAAGLAGLLKVVLGLQHGRIPAHLHFNTPSPFIAWNDLGIGVASRPTPFPRIGGRRIAGLSAFGFSGTNAHVVIEEAPPVSEAAAPAHRRPLSLLTVSARNAEALRVLVESYRRLLAAPGADLADVAFSANTGRSPMEHRLALIAENAEEAGAALDGFLAGEPVDGLRSGVFQAADPLRLAFVFAGEDGPGLATGRRFYDEEPVFRQAFDACDALFAPHLTGSLADVFYAAGAPAVIATPFSDRRRARAAAFAVAWASACLWRSWGLEPGLVVGAGVGEYIAACLGGVFSLADAVDLVASQENQAQFDAVARRVAMADPKITLVASMTGRPARRGEISNADYWRRQARGGASVQEGCRAAAALGYRVFLEFGAGSSPTDRAATSRTPDGLFLPTLVVTEEPWRTAMETLSRLYLEGAAIDWAAFDGPYTRRRVALPTYPFQRSRFWLSPPRSRAPQLSTGSQTGHPHLTRRTDSATGDVIFETRLEPGRYPYLADHVVNGSPILPAAFFIDLAASAVAQAFPNAGVVLENLVIHEPVSIPEDGCDIQVILSSLSEGDVGRGEAQLFGKSASHVWRRAVTAEFVRNAPRSSEPDGTARDEGLGVRTSPAELVPIDRLYAAFDNVGVAFGPAFRRLTGMRRAEGEAHGEIESQADDAAGFSLHPAALDACLQTLAAALPGLLDGSRQTDLYMPIAVDRFELYRPSAGPLRSFARIEPAAGMSGSAPPETLTGHVIIEDTAGVVVARITGVRLKRAGGAPAATKSLDSLLYGIDWQPDALIADAQSSLLADFAWSDSAPALAQLQREVRARSGLAAAAVLEPELDALCAAYVLKAFADLGWRFPVGQEVTTRELAMRVAPDHRRLLGRLLAILAEDAYLLRLTPASRGASAGRIADGDERWRIAKDLTPPRVTPSVADLADRFPDFRPEILFAERGGRHLAAALRGEVDASEVLFPDGSFELADELYRRSPAAVAFNALAAAATAEAVRRAPPDRTMRVLEIGGGTGGITSAILPTLPPERTTYEFTDLSPAFLKKAASGFSAFPFVRYETLDIERDPEEQGFTLGSYDLIVASNVLHATSDLSDTLDHVRSLLAPGGKLLCLEGLAPRRWIDLSFGLTAGWWNFSDTDLRPDYPLLPAADWRRLLVGKGFSEPVFAPAETRHESQALILAGLETMVASAKAATGAARTYLIFADRAGIADGLSAKLSSRGSDCVMVRRGSAFRVGGDGECAIDPEVPENYHALFQALKDRGRGVDAVVFLWPVDCDIQPDATTAQLEAELRECCGSLLTLIQALGRAAGGAGSRLWVATRSAQSVVAGDRVDGLPQTGIFGLARTASQELPEIACRCFDLEGEGDVDALIDELDGPHLEPLVAIRGGRRYVARLTRAADMVAATVDSQDAPRQLEIIERGAIEGLALRPQQPAELGDSEVEIAVRAAGLNFRDVLNVLGAREDAAALGGEVAGVISRIGAAVRDLQIGQSVVAVTSGGLGDYAVAGADLVLEKPDRLSFEEAASSPLAFLTAHYALNVIGKMAAGERILIHAAAGGVGMAAAQLALRAGLDVFATAGSAEKRDYLRTIGIGRVFDSRSLDFADGVGRETGGEGVDLVIGAVTGPAIAAGLRLLRPGGRFLEIGKAEILTRADVERINPDARYHAIDLAELIVREPLAVRPMFVDLMARLAAGALQPLPVATFALDDARQAFAHMARARHIGKVVLSMSKAGPELGRSSAGPLRSDATYLITGGLTGLGLATARRLVERGARSLALVGRRPPDGGASIAIEQMRRQGARVVVVQADVSSDADMRRLFEGALSDAPPLRGVVHSAGVLEDAGLMQQTWSRFAEVLAPKAKGAWLLHRLTADTPLDFFVLFSSASALLGAPGQSNHAAANAFLDGLAHYRRARGMPALSINWGAWSDIGAAAERNVAQRIGKRGVGELSVDEGLGAFERLLNQPLSQVGVIRADWPRVAASLESVIDRPFLARLADAPLRRDANTVEPAPAPAAFDLASAPLEKRAGLLTSLVKAQVADVLATANPDAVSEQQPFREMGLDSLMALELRSRLRKALSLDAPLPATLAFDYPTVANLVRYLMTDIYGWVAPVAAANGRDDRPLLDEIEAMSDEDVDRLFALRVGVS